MEAISALNWCTWALFQVLCVENISDTMLSDNDRIRRKQAIPPYLSPPLPEDWLMQSKPLCVREGEQFDQMKLFWVRHHTCFVDTALSFVPLKKKKSAKKSYLMQHSVHSGQPDCYRKRNGGAWENKYFPLLLFACKEEIIQLRKGRKKHIPNNKSFNPFCCTVFLQSNIIAILSHRNWPITVSLHKMQGVRMRRAGVVPKEEQSESSAHPGLLPTLHR